ncbi:MAG: TIGR01777 family oxidoreductase [Anaerolineae bacterium]|nr:TIGR01777 family oxidoreductase [Anaerolineae bacterium]MDW8099821.1 TIGR01777 family oxidoreductase [Anaerolineae bacterium]
MKAVVTGGTGLIGRALVAQLTADGWDVVVLTRNPARATGLPARAQAVYWDGQTAREWGKLMDGATAVVNLAGENISAGRWTHEQKRRIRESRLAAGRAIVEAIQQATVKPQVLIQSSAVGFYGNRGAEELDERSAPGRGFLPDLCQEWERSTEAVEALGIRRAVIRTGIVLSLAGGALPRLLLPFRFFVGGPLGDGRQWFPWIHLADEIRAIRYLMDNPNGTGVFNLTAPQPVTNAELSRVVGRVLRRPSLIPVPALALRLAFGEMATILLDSQRVFPRRLLELGFTFRFPDITSALHDLLR